MIQRILLIEDDRLSRESLRFLLQREGYMVMAVASAEEAKLIATTCALDAAIIDIRLPGMRGDDFAAFLHTRCPAARLLFVSGEFVVDNLARFGRAATFFPKPVDLNALLGALKN